MNGLLYHCPDIEGTGCDLRPGIVHRLDKDTSGAMVVAKNLPTLNALSAMFKNREVYKQYTAIVYGDVKADSGVIKLPVGRHPRDRKRMSTHSNQGKAAETHFSINSRYNGASRLDFILKTGRTHQIRVHCLSMGHPIVGDQVYAMKGRSNVNAALFKSSNRQMLHSETLSFTHPANGQKISFTAPIPDDMQNIIDKLTVSS